MAKKPPNPQCKATSKRSGERCKNRARDGYEVCRMHGAGNKASRPPGGPIIHGRYSKRFKKLQADGRELMDELQEDPDLFDLKLEVAASAYMMFQAPLDPDEDVVKNLARMRMGKNRREKGAEPTEAELELARMEMRAFAGKEIREHAKMKINAARQRADAEVLMKQAIPIMDEFVESVSRLVGRFLTPEQRVEFAQALAAHREAAMGKIARLRET